MTESYLFSVYKDWGWIISHRQIQLFKNMVFFLRQRLLAGNKTILDENIGGAYSKAFENYVKTRKEIIGTQRKIIILIHFLVLKLLKGEFNLQMSNFFNISIKSRSRQVQWLFSDEENRQLKPSEKEFGDLVRNFSLFKTFKPGEKHQWLKTESISLKSSNRLSNFLQEKDTVYTYFSYTQFEISHTIFKGKYEANIITSKKNTRVSIYKDKVKNVVLKVYDEGNLERQQKLVRESLSLYALNSLLKAPLKTPFVSFQGLVRFGNEFFNRKHVNFMGYFMSYGGQSLKCFFAKNYEFRKYFVHYSLQKPRKNIKQAINNFFENKLSKSQIPDDQVRLEMHNKYLSNLKPQRAARKQVNLNKFIENKFHMFWFDCKPDNITFDFTKTKQLFCIDPDPNYFALIVNRNNSLYSKPCDTVVTANKIYAYILFTFSLCKYQLEEKINFQTVYASTSEQAEKNVISENYMKFQREWNSNLFFLSYKAAIADLLNFGLEFKRSNDPLFFLTQTKFYEKFVDACSLIEAIQKEHHSKGPTKTISDPLFILEHYFESHERWLRNKISNFKESEENIKKKYRNFKKDLKNIILTINRIHDNEQYSVCKTVFKYLLIALCMNNKKFFKESKNIRNLWDNVKKNKYG